MRSIKKTLAAVQTRRRLHRMAGYSAVAAFWFAAIWRF